MALPTRSLDDIVKRSLAYFRTSFPGFPMGTKKFLGRTARAVGLNLWGLQKSIEQVDLDIVPSPQSSTDALSDWAFTIGLPDGAGGFGRLLPTVSSGGQATLTGVKGTIYPDATVATAEDGTTQIALSGLVTIPGAPPGLGSVTGAFVSVTKGTVANLPIGTVCTWVSTPPGADPTFTLTAPLQGAVDAEDNPSVYARIVARLQTPPRGGVAEDHRVWIQDAVPGIAQVFVYPKRSGTGTVDNVIVTSGTGQARRPSAQMLDDAQDALDENKPAGSEAATALLPYMPNGSGHLVRVQVVPSAARYRFDWDDTVGGPFTVFAYSAGPSATLELNTLAPQTLKNAIDAFNAGTGLKPRLQVLSTGSVINVPIGCTAWVDALGRTTLTLEAVPATWVAPTVGDTVYAYGPVVATIAAGILALADSLGPSRASGFGDPITPWFDKLALSSIIAVAEDAIDSDGTQLIFEVPPGLATIDGLAADVTGSDGVNGPELLYLSHVAVTAAP